MKACIFTVICIPLIANRASASEDSIGPNGINSAVLGLNGNGVPIGQVERERPGKHGFDDAVLTHEDVIPFAVFIQNMNANMNSGIDPLDAHPLEVAGAIISDDDTAAGVAPSASLYSSAILPDVRLERHLVALQHVALQAGGDVRAINMSYGTGQQTDPLDGNSELTLFMDWSARQHDVLYVKAGPETGPSFGRDLGDDNYNGMTIGSSTRDSNGVFREVSSFNVQRTVDQGDRTFISLIAPGESIEVPTDNNAFTIRSGN